MLIKISIPGWLRQWRWLRAFRHLGWRSIACSSGFLLNNLSRKAAFWCYCPRLWLMAIGWWTKSTSVENWNYIWHKLEESVWVLIQECIDLKISVGLQGWPTARVSGWWQLAGETKTTRGLQGWPTARVSGWWQLAGETKTTSVENWN
jgi:hypothetical protein